MSLVRFRPEAPNGYADLAHLVERHLAKVEVASSSLVIRSIGRLINLKRPNFLKNRIRHHSQVVRQRSAKPLCPSSNLGGASKKQEQVFRLALVFCVCVRRTQHRLTVYGQHHFLRSKNIIVRLRTQNDVASPTMLHLTV